MQEKCQLLLKIIEKLWINCWKNLRSVLQPSHKGNQPAMRRASWNTHDLWIWLKNNLCWKWAKFLWFFSFCIYTVYNYLSYIIDILILSRPQKKCQSFSRNRSHSKAPHRSSKVELRPLLRFLPLQSAVLKIKKSPIQNPSKMTKALRTPCNNVQTTCSRKSRNGFPKRIFKLETHRKSSKRPRWLKDKLPTAKSVSRRTSFR